MHSWDELSKRAKNCQTKQTWEDFFHEFGQQLRSINHSKPLYDIFKYISSDRQSLHYPHEFWEILLNGCLSSWNLELGRKIADFVHELPSISISIPAARVFLESGFPQQARKIALRALRLQNLSDWEKLQLEMLCCSSYVEEGKHSLAVRMLNKMHVGLGNKSLNNKERAEFLMNIARVQYFLGRYASAVIPFKEAYEIYLQLADWETAARAIFNAAACYDNDGSSDDREAFAMVEECRRISEAHDLKGPLSHCEAFYGQYHFWRGNFASAREHFRSALEFLPISDKSFRRLHILSMLALTYLRTGRYHLGFKFGQQTLKLAGLDESSRFRSRYQMLESELLWEQGEIDKSQNILSQATTPSFTRGIHTLEELSALSRYYWQSAQIANTATMITPKINDRLKKNTALWVEYLHALATVHLSKQQYDVAYKYFDEALERSKQFGDRYHLCLCLLGQLQTRLAEKAPLNTLTEQLRELKIAVGQMGESPLKTDIQIIHAALAYRSGDFTETQRYLQIASKQNRTNFTNKFLISCWLATIHGHTKRLSSPAQMGLLAHYTRIYFSPTILAFEKRIYKISDNFIVDLTRHPAIADLFDYLLMRTNYNASMEEIQTNVWHESLHNLGWKQKIRNTIMRLRNFFPYTMAPLILHSDEVRIFEEAIIIQNYRKLDLTMDAEIIRLLSEGPLSTTQLSNRLNISNATTKRVLKRLSEREQITIMRFGRKVIYQALKGNVAEQTSV